MKFVVVDFQGFCVSGQFYPKELAIYDGRCTSHFIFKPPCEFNSLSSDEKKSVRYLEREHHGLKYSKGYVTLEEIPAIIKDFLMSPDIIYVKGYQKINFLEEKFREMDISDYPRITNLEANEWIPSLQEFFKYPMCMAHSEQGKRMCSIAICKELYDWILKCLP